MRYYLYGQPDNGHSEQPIIHYRDQRAMAVGVDSSTKLSSFLAVGALSPRMVHKEAMRYLTPSHATSGPGPRRPLYLLMLSANHFPIS